MYKLTTHHQHVNKKKSLKFEDFESVNKELTLQLDYYYKTYQSKNYNIITTFSENGMSANLSAFKPNEPDVNIIWTIEELED